MKDVVQNQFKMTNATFVGTDKDNNPFKIHAVAGNQEFNKPDIVFLTKPSGTIVRNTQKGKIKDTMSADKGQFNHKTRVLKLNGNVRVNSSNGDKILTDELVIKL